MSADQGHGEAQYVLGAIREVLRVAAELRVKQREQHQLWAMCCKLSKTKQKRSRGYERVWVRLEDN
jgi:hypothetical protein